MEEPKSESEVTLVLRGIRITAQKYMLARNSLYFAALFSANFKDHQQNEFDINYDISLVTLQVGGKHLQIRINCIIIFPNYN